MSSTVNYCPEDAVTLAWLESVLQGAFLEVVDRHENSLWVRGKAFTLQLLIDPVKKAISVVVAYQNEEDWNFLQRVVEANNCNAVFGWARFYLLQTEKVNRPRLVVDYTLSYERGLVPYHIVQAIDLLERVAARGVAKEFLKARPGEA
jgi:hypothetical protein